MSSNGEEQKSNIDNVVGRFVINLETGNFIHHGIKSLVANINGIGVAIHIYIEEAIDWSRDG
ncbi:MAG: hypothetical protein IJ816_03125 [Alloprevotella sp.]|nr:hypothetical protein [Alloprevotella sp.]